MKYFTLFLFLLLPNYLFGQSHNDCWIPEAYINAIETNDTINATSLLIPVAAFYRPFKNCRVYCYGSEFRDVNTKDTIINGNKKRLIINLGNHINLQATPPKGSIYDTNTAFPFLKLSDKLNNSLVTISMVGNKLLLEIINGNEYEKFVFVSTINNKPIKEVDSYLKYYNLR